MLLECDEINKYKNTFARYSDAIFWDFKRKDNVKYNFSIVISLCSCMKAQSMEVLSKPTVLIIASILECTLFDFLTRVYQHRKEAIPNLSDTDIREIQRKTVKDKFRQCIEMMKARGIYGDRTSELSGRLVKISEIRNRIHIQNTKPYYPKDEDELFDNCKVINAGELLKDIYSYLCKHYPRPTGTGSTSKLDMINDKFPEPWEKLHNLYN